MLMVYSQQEMNFLKVADPQGVEPKSALEAELESISPVEEGRGQLLPAADRTALPIPNLLPPVQKGIATESYAP